jgi:predicted Rossmann fold flavoprotein
MWIMDTDVVIIGAGAAGLMCAGVAGARGQNVLVLEHTSKVGEKIRISGGGRCNFTNIHTAPDKFISNNPRFCASALARYTHHDFVALVEKHGIAYHEKTLGQLFCDISAVEIIDMLVNICKSGHVDIKTSTTVDKITRDGDVFVVSTSAGVVAAKSLVIATGGLSIPKIGATPFGYDIAKQFGLNIVPPRAGLVPLTFDPLLLQTTKELSGVSIDPVKVHSKDGMSFDEAMLFTHKGISGPAILQISSYWNTGEDVVLNMAPSLDVLAWLKQQRLKQAKSMLHTVLSDILPKRLAEVIAEDEKITSRMGDLSDKVLERIAGRIQNWRVKPSGSEGYRTAEVTLGGVDTNAISSKTFEATNVKGLYFIGEVLDVTGHLGGYNFQWAWSSGWCAGQYV